MRRAARVVPNESSSNSCSHIGCRRSTAESLMRQNDYTVFQKNQAPKTLDGSNFVKF